ncbi:hypothetical protein [Metabacillus indicus]|uniref:hypothetical protein n=1 Tax=Metabacillus indicus TaxID=246786 RepID=UPI0004937535|nr:hypothetical protein [Metabacillus indicus]KEZ51328.1 hypothetical protein AZ46_0212165 [Metabacillus indicus LMG 22858]
MLEYIIVDSDGKIIDSVLLQDYEPVPENHVKPWGDRGFFEPKWDFERGDWIEGLVSDEVERKRNENLASQRDPGPEEMNSMAILELTNMIFGGMGVE